MAGNPKKPQVGELSIDASALAPFLVDLPPGALQGMRTEQEGFDEVLKEILANQAEFGELAGVTQKDLDGIQKANTEIAQIDTFLPPAQKLAEVLVESRGKADDRRQRLVSAIAQSLESRAKSGHPELLAKYEKTRRYRSAIGVKAAKTRERNAKEKAAAAKKEAKDPDPTP